MGLSYQELLAKRRRTSVTVGPDVPASDVHPSLKPHQVDIVRWAVKGRRRAIWADTGLGKTRMQLEWCRLSADTSLIVAPLAVCQQTCDEAAAIGITARATYAGEMCAGGCGFELFAANRKPVEGKRRHLREGRCYPCYGRAAKAPLDEAQALVLVPELSAMMRARKARQEKQARVEKARAVEYARYLHYKKTRTPA